MLNRSVILMIAATLFAAIFAFSILWLTSCGSPSGNATPNAPQGQADSDAKRGETQATHAAGQGLPKSADADQVYLTRARIDALPSADGKFSLMLHHEEIKDFVGKNGTVVGMKEMIMPFADLAPGVELTGFKVNDLVEVVFEVRWNKAPRTLLTSIRPLPADTKLNLSKVVEDTR